MATSVLALANEYLSSENDRLRGELARVGRETVERAAAELDEAAALRRKTAKEKDFEPDHSIAIKVAMELEFIAAAIRALEPRHD